MAKIDRYMFCEKSKPCVINKSTCTECNKTNTKVIQITAEENAGEHYVVEVCHECLLRFVEMIG